MEGKPLCERINALRLLKDRYSRRRGIKVLYDAIVQDKFYGVAIEAANTLGSFYDKNNYENLIISYQCH
ncbi:MAG: hypothetical protein P0116_09650 [Candidatus Nitrosocosmicus sp.]|nr:hypothetical protein [Candidatus Nitrosocosmicus sp.]